jgi:hypothetical protein
LGNDKVDSTIQGTGTFDLGIDLNLHLNLEMISFWEGIILLKEGVHKVSKKCNGTW